MTQITPNEEQEKILEEESNCVVTAKPGSGKTFTITQKVRRVLPTLPHYKGIIAISFTNKASDELERRCLRTGIDKKSSYFGTIDSFFITEIIIPFGAHIFGLPENEMQVLQFEDLENPKDFDSLKDIKPLQTVSPNIIKSMRSLFIKGIIILETVGFLALYVFDVSYACRRYLRAKFSHVFIDEYQDCDVWQHELFNRLVRIGLCGVAVGDIDQSIFAFAGKDPKYLTELAQDRRFNYYPLTTNHRCHTSIINYSTKLLSETFTPIPTEEVRVLHKHISGSELAIAEWLSEAIPIIIKHFGISQRNNVAILVKNRPTGNLIHRHLAIEHKPIIRTPLDNETSLWGSMFRRILTWVFSPELTKRELVEKYLHVDYQPKTVHGVMKKLNEIETIAQHNPALLNDYVAYFIQVAESIFPLYKNQTAISNLRNVLASDVFLNSFIPANENEVQLMTLHKAKGLEFDLVFHLNLYRWILPQYKGDERQDKNLHYVGITRAKECCVLCTSSQRHNYSRQIVDAENSEFLDLNELNKLRIQCPF